MCHWGKSTNNNNKQHGFCKGKSTNTATAEFIERVYKSLDEREIGRAHV
jgi:hypothetical protein